MPAYKIYNPIVGRRIKDRAKAEGIILSRLANLYYAELGFECARTANDRICTIGRGYPYMSTSPVTAENPENIVILSRVFKAMGFPKDDEAVTEMRKSDKRFAYPPRDGVSYHNIKDEIASQIGARLHEHHGPVYKRTAMTLSAR